MWRAIHVLTSRQAFVVSVLAAAVISCPIALYPLSHSGFLLTLACSVLTSLAFVVIFGALLGYYRAGVFGFFASAIFSAMAWILASFLAYLTVDAVGYLGVRIRDDWGFLLLLVFVTVISITLTYLLLNGSVGIKLSARPQTLFTDSQHIAMR